MRCGSSLIITDGTTTVSPATEIDFTSGATVLDAGGGVADVSIPTYIPPTSTENVQSTSQLIAAGASSFLIMSHQSGSALLSYSTPTAPAIGVTGIYAVTVEVVLVSGAITVGRQISGALEMLSSHGTCTFVSTFTSATGATSGVVSMCGVVLMIAGDPVKILVTNNDTAGRTFAIDFCTVQRIT